MGDKDCCRIVLFFKASCLNFNHVIIMKYFHNVFSCYGRSKPQKVKCQTNYIFSFHTMWCYNIFAQRKLCHIILKNENILKKLLKFFLISMKIVVFIKHYYLIWLEYVCEPCENFDNYHKWVFFKVMTINMWHIYFWKIITFKWNMRINVRWTICKSSISNVFGLINSNWKHV